MSELRRQWIEAGERFADLGRKFQERYQGRVGEDVDDRLHNAIEGAMHAVEEVLISAGHALGDGSELREDAQRSLSALHDALCLTFTDATQAIEDAAGKLRLGLAELSRHTEVVDRV